MMNPQKYRPNFIIKRRSDLTRIKRASLKNSTLSHKRTFAGLGALAVLLWTAPVTESVNLNRAPQVQPFSANHELQKIETEMKQIQGVEALQKNNGTELSVTLASDSFFKIGTAQIVAQSQMVLKEITDLLKRVPQAWIEIEGHTDSSPIIKQKKFFQSNWELSAARAASFLHVFEEEGFKRNQLKVIGYGDSRPVAENAAKNRRIVLQIHMEGGNAHAL